MSGICGMVHFDGAPVICTELHQMAHGAAHRAPDGIRYWIDGHAGVAHLAFNLTPEAGREQQPLASQGNDLVVTADARLDNRDDLIHTLTARGHLLKPDPTDADLIMAAYRCWDTACPAHLLGDFALAIWDAPRRRLLAARDAMAMRPFYYRMEAQRLWFASEIKQLLALAHVSARLFEPAVGAHLAGLFGPLEWTFYDGIAQLPPAHTLLVDSTGHRTWRYWDIDPDCQIRYAHEEEYAEHFLELFKEAVRHRLRSVKPIGLLLSGGMDSGSIAATAGWLLQQRCSGVPPAFRTYCFAFEELPQCDERHISNGIVQHYGFPVTAVSADAAWPLKDYPAHGPDRDDPFVGVYQALLEHAMAAARSEGTGLMLSGDRGDLMMGGWILSYPRLLRSRQWRALRDELQVHSQATGEPLGNVVGSYLLKPLLAALGPRRLGPWLQRRVCQMVRRSSTREPLCPDWVRPDFAQRVRLADIHQQSEPQPNVPGFARRQRYQLVFTFMHMQSMVWSERSQARFGLGFADPWSDRQIASFVLAVPQQVLNRPEEINKRLVRQAMCGIMPEAVRQAADKILPSPLYERALKEQARATVLDLITQSTASAYGFIDARALRQHYEAMCRGAVEHPGFWCALTLEMWLRQYWC